MKKLFFFFSCASLALLLGGGNTSFAQEQCAPLVYKQERLLMLDPTGDQVLLKLFLDTCETGLKKIRQRSNVAPKESQLRSPRFEQENPILEEASPKRVDNASAVPLFRADTLVTDLMGIIEMENRQGRQASIGRPHRWAKSRFMLSKIIVALATASSARFLYVGQEVPLIEWIKKQPDNSITIEQLFRRSYKLNNGDVYLTLLTIENVLSDATFEADRENTIVNRKLADLYANSPNKFGDWYHFFGTMLAGYVREPAVSIAKIYGTYRKISRGEEAEKATMAADRAGARAGVDLRNSLEKEVNGWWNHFLRQLEASAMYEKRKC